MAPPMLIAMWMKMTVFEAYTGKIFESAMASLDHVRQSLDKSAINRAVDLLTQAKKIAFFGLGSSAAVAHDAMNKFFRFNVPVIYSDDIVLQRMSCMNCSDDDVVVLIRILAEPRAWWNWRSWRGKTMRW
nr:DNA-binding transcriptional regulator HexR [Salmonella sp. NCTC 7297]